MSEINFQSISSILKGVLKLLDIPKPPDIPIAPPLVLASANRNGTSAKRIAAKIIKRQPEAGIPVGALPDGSVNPTEQMYVIIAEEILNEIYTNGRITVAIKPGIPITASGVAAGGLPVVVQGITTSFGSGSAIFQVLLPFVFLLNCFL